jgi:hypothetical protein
MVCTVCDENAGVVGLTDEPLLQVQSQSVHLRNKPIQSQDETLRPPHPGQTPGLLQG